MTEREDWGTVLFLDIAGSTKLTQTLGNQEAGRRILKLLDQVQAMVTSHGGRVIKCDGDDLLSVFDGREGSAASGARAAIEAQKIAQDQGLAFYTGLCFGQVIHQMVLGRPDISGLAVNIAARLHKLIEGTPGLIFLDSATADQLPEDLRERCGDFGSRLLKGVGETEVLSLQWKLIERQDSTVFHRGAKARLADATSPRTMTQPLSRHEMVLSHGGRHHRIGNQQTPILLGRSEGGAHWIAISGDGVSGRHAEILWDNGVWLLKDMSRCGTWLRMAGSPQDIPLSGRSALLMGSGAICLGRPFSDDAEGEVTVAFLVEAV